MCCRYGFKTDVQNGARQRKHPPVDLVVVVHPIKAQSPLKQQLHHQDRRVQAAHSLVPPRLPVVQDMRVGRRADALVCLLPRHPRHLLHLTCTHPQLKMPLTSPAVPLTRSHPWSLNRLTDGQLALPQMLSQRRDFNLLLAPAQWCLLHQLACLHSILNSHKHPSPLTQLPLCP